MRPMHSPSRASTRGSRCAWRAFKSARCSSKACSTAGSSIRRRPQDSSSWCTRRSRSSCCEQAGAGEPFRIWLKLDTGMNRLGFKGAAFDAALEALRALPRVQSPVNLFTHLASADDPDSPATADQLARFESATAALGGERSIANSAGLLGFPQAQADWVRPGLLLYGVSPFDGSIGADYGLKPAMTLKSHVIALKDLAPGRARRVRRTMVRCAPDALGGGGGRLWRWLSAQSRLGLAGARERRARAARGPRFDGYDRRRRHGPREHAADRRPRRASGAAGCRSRSSPSGRTRFRTSFCAGSVSASR